MSKINVDFSNVKEDYSIPVGKMNVKIKGVTTEDGKEYPYLKWDLQILDGEGKGLSINHITSLSPKALFGLKDLLEAVGIDVPKSSVSFDPNKLIGKKLRIQTFEKEQNGKTYVNVKKVFKVSDASDSLGVTASDISEDDLTDLDSLSEDEL